MGQDVGGHRLHVVWKDVIAARDGRQGTGGAEEREAGARATPQLERGIRPCLPHQADGVAAHRRLHMEPPERRDQADQLLGLDHGRQVIERVSRLEPREDLVLPVLIGVADLQAQEEAVELRFRERERPLQLDRVLGGDDEKGPRELHRHPLDRQLALLHRFEERCLRAGRRPVDLVREDYLGDQRAFAKDEFAEFLVVVVDPRDVRGHQVGRELDAPEAATERSRDRPRERRLAGAGHLFEEDVALAEKRHQGEPDDLRLADDDPLHARLERRGGLFDDADILRGEAVGRAFFGQHSADTTRPDSPGRVGTARTPISGAPFPVPPVHSTPMPAVQRIALSYNNVYVVDTGGGRVLIDTGPDYRGAFEAIEAALGGRTIDEVLATHGHSDHAGLGHAWRERGVPVALGAADAALVAHPPLSNPVEFARMRAFVETSGAPPEGVAEALDGLERRRAYGRTAMAAYPPPGSRPHWPTGLRLVPYTPGRLITGDGQSAGLRILAAPGHTPGNLVAVEAQEGWLFSGDQLLPEITPTPAVQADPAEAAGWRFRSLPAFVRSLERLAAMEFTRCYPGHGEPFDNVGETIQANLDAIEQRTERVATELAAGGPATLYGLCERIYPRAIKRRFWQILPTVLGHLDLLEEAGRATQRSGLYEPA